MRHHLIFILGLLICLGTVPSTWADAPARRPNIIWIMADDLGYGDLGCYGQKVIQTPHIDRLAGQGTRFTSFYAGSTVCAPSRSVLMTGLHSGHTRIRGNARVPLEPGDVTVAQLLKKAGYRTGLVGKWGLGEPGSTGVPNRKGFDYFFGYLNQHHAHNYFPDHLWRNEEKVPLPNVLGKKDAMGGGVATERKVYSAHLFEEEAVRFIRESKDGPFFLYLALTLPHANNEAGKAGMEIPDYGIYTDKPWPDAQKGHAAMITLMDKQVGAVMALLKELKLEEETVLFFTSDNGPHREGGADPNFFRSSGPLRGIKRALYEGGIRVPMIVRWPGKVKGGAVSDHAWAMWDFLPTACNLAGVDVPEGIDGRSHLPLLRGEAQQGHEFLYWEFHEGQASKQAVRMGDWKGVRQSPAARLELYNLTMDIGEKQDVASMHPDVVAKMEAFLKTARTESAHWPLKQGQAGRRGN